MNHKHLDATPEDSQEELTPEKPRAGPLFSAKEWKPHTTIKKGGPLATTRE